MTRSEAIEVLKHIIGNINWDEEREEIYFTDEWVQAYEMAIAALKAEPMKHGRWVDHMVRDWHCSECGKKLTGHGWDGYCYKNLPRYCPNCGAKMNKGDKEIKA